MVSMKYLKITCKKAKSVTIDPDTDYYMLYGREVLFITKRHQEQS
jgi:hypothetical protein